MSPWSLVTEERKEVCQSSGGGGEYCRCLKRPMVVARADSQISPSCADDKNCSNLLDRRMLMYMENWM